MGGVLVLIESYLAVRQGSTVFRLKRGTQEDTRSLSVVKERALVRRIRRLTDGRVALVALVVEESSEAFVFGAPTSQPWQSVLMVHRGFGFTTINK